MSRPSINLSATSHEILRHLHPDIKQSIRKAMDLLLKNPYAGKPLKAELEGLWSLPAFHHRIIYQIEGNAVTVIFIGPRRDVYHRLREILSQR